MFNTLWERLHTFQDHHQMLFGLIVTFAIISASWGLEKLFETYLFPRKPVYGYFFAVIVGLCLLWFTKHLILQEV